MSTKIKIKVPDECYCNGCQALVDEKYCEIFQERLVVHGDDIYKTWLCFKLYCKAKSEELVKTIDKSFKKAYEKATEE